MKRLKEYIREDHKFLVKSKAKPQEYKYFPKTEDELIDIIEKRIKEDGYDCDLNNIDVSKVEKMIGLFADENAPGGSTTRCRFNGDISLWDVSNIKDMYSMFRNSDFNGDISNWDVSNVQDTRYMFEDSMFDGDISNWDVSNVTTMSGMFSNSEFNRDISDWDVSKVKFMNYMFANSKFNQGISKWDVRTVDEMDGMFLNCPLENNPPKWYRK